MKAVDHARALAISVRTTTNIRRMTKRKTINIQPAVVIKVLNGAGIKFTLVGAHGIAGWLEEPRATQDVDVLIHAQHRKASRAIKNAYPSLKIQELSAVTRFLDPGTGSVVLDLMKSQAALHKAVAKNTFLVGASYSIPDLEMAIVLKFTALISPNRTARKRLLDKADIFGMVEKNYEIIDKEKLLVLAELAKPAGGAELWQLIQEAHAESGPDPHG